ncbi:MAG: symmetrical bis(5'-nucleosyl)-tetraphosphatase [Gammaproteobacteria bacterium]|nr:symmetrical bis(5'-nucleosyl)-tetraphosphatase [Gammaproteobacteria bacterium]
MSTYAIGDIQGCFHALEKLLNAVSFDNNNDVLWFTGDLVNRGPQSLETLRFIKQLGEQHKIVLGNHDLHLLAVAHDAHPGLHDDTLTDILEAPDREDIIHWLSHQPLFYYDEKINFALVHAGVAPMWTANKAISLSKEVEDVLQSDSAKTFFLNMYGNEPDLWEEDLQSWGRLRCITNYFTRIRYCTTEGRLELNNKGKLENSPTNHVPWFNAPNRKTAEINILFGHWAALGGITNTPHVFALDTGYVWGYHLTAMRLEDGKLFSIT